MNTKRILFLSVASALAIFAVGCGDDMVTPIDGGSHPDLGRVDSGMVDGGVDLGTSPDLGTGVDAGDAGATDLGTTTDMGTFLTDAGCWEGPPSTMVQFLNHCTDRSTPASVTGNGLHSTLIYADGGVPPIP